MAMMDGENLVGRLSGDARIAGDAIRYAVASELLIAVAATLRFVLLSPRTWVSGRYTEAERDMLRLTVVRMEACTLTELAERCPLCGAGGSCDDGCPLGEVRMLLESRQ